LTGTPVSQGVALARDVVRIGGRRFWWVGGLGVAAGLVESGGLLVLPSLLRVLGVDGGAAALSVLSPVGRILGLQGTLLCYVLLAALISGIVYAHAVAANGLMLDYGDSLRRRLHAAVLSMRWGSPALRRPADLTHAMTVEVAQCGFAVRQFLAILAASAQLPALLAAALVLSAPFTLAVVVLSVGFLLLTMPLGRRAHRLATAMMEARRDLHAELADQVAGLRVLKILRAEDKCREAFLQRIGRLRHAESAQIRVVAGATQLQRIVIAVAAALGIAFGLSVLRVPLAELLVLVLLFGRLMTVCARFQEQGRQILRVLPVHAALERRLRDCLAVAESSVDAPPPSLRREIRLEDVGYRPDDAEPILSAIDAVIPAFAVTAVVGPSGAGKSTLADLVMGLIAPTEGRLRVDDVAMEDAARLSWRCRVGYVPQDSFLFHDSIRANLLLARPDAGEADLWEALDLAEAGFVRALPQGLDSPVGDRGLRLSGGERQRIVLARALVRRPDLLVLDEATSALDEATERQLFASLVSQRGRLTLLVISHRSSVVALADHVIRLESGRMVK